MERLLDGGCQNDLAGLRACDWYIANRSLALLALLGVPCRRDPWRLWHAHNQPRSDLSRGRAKDIGYSTRLSSRAALAKLKPSFRGGDFSRSVWVYMRSPRATNSWIAGELAWIVIEPASPADIERRLDPTFTQSGTKPRLAIAGFDKPKPQRHLSSYTDTNSTMPPG